MRGPDSSSLGVSAELRHVSWNHGLQVARPIARIASWLRRYPLGAAGAGILTFFIVFAMAAPFVAPYDPIATNFSQALVRPSGAHWLGTDNLGRDQLSRIMFGARPALKVGLISTLLSLIVGASVGLLAGYRGGQSLDHLVMRVMDALQAFPAIVLALAVTAALGLGLSSAIAAITVVNVPFFTRLARGQVLAAREEMYIEAVRASGARESRIMARHLLPNIASPLLVQAYLTVGYAIILEATLSFLGVGVQPPEPSWGGMLKAGYPFLTVAPWLAVGPGAAIFVMVLGLTLLGDALWASLDPRLARAGRASGGRESD